MSGLYTFFTMGRSPRVDPRLYNLLKSFPALTYAMIVEGSNFVVWYTSQLTNQNRLANRAENGHLMRATQPHNRLQRNIELLSRIESASRGERRGMV
jgi:hypothetical protein